MYQKISIKEWAEEDRPREKLLKFGARGLSNAELLAILIGSGNTEESAVDLSRRILKTVGNDLNKLSQIQISELLNFRGIGTAKAVHIVAAIELSRRWKSSVPQKIAIISSSADAAAYLQLLLGQLKHEEFWVLLLNRSNRIIDQIMVSKGGVSGTVIDVRIILKKALEKLCSHLILCHNHPSGNLQPSKADIAVTKKIGEASRLMDIEVIDHIIIGGENYFSFADEGILNF